MTPLVPAQEQRMTYRTPASTAVAGAFFDDGAADTDRRQRVTALGLVWAVIVVDQATKWWAWRHVPVIYINSGSTWPIGEPVTGWLAGATSGRLLDVAAVGLFSLAGFLLLRRRRGGLVLVTGFLIIGGWSSNLLDRLGLHSVTAPGSPRGAVDFIHVGTPYTNVADLIIVGATTVLAVSACAATVGRSRAAAGRGVAVVTLRRRSVPVRVCVAVAGLVVTVVLSAARPIGAAIDPWVDSSPKTSTEAGTHA
jgi:lipoprotein signal peptidase